MMFKKGDLVTNRAFLPQDAGLGICVSEKIEIKNPDTLPNHSSQFCITVHWFVKPHIWNHNEDSFDVNFAYLKKAKQ